MAGVDGQHEAMDLSSTAQSTNVLTFIPWTQSFTLTTGSQLVSAPGSQPPSTPGSQPSSPRLSLANSMKTHTLQEFQVKKEPVTSPVEVDMPEKKQKMAAGSSTGTGSSSKSSKKGGSKGSKQVCMVHN